MIRNAYWPWWLGGLSLAALAVSFPFLTGKALGVSGAIAQATSWPFRRRRTEAGPHRAVAPGPEAAQSQRPSVPDQGCSATPPVAATDRAGRSNDLAFVIGIVLGGTLAGLLTSGSWGHGRLWPGFHELFGGGLKAWLILFAGGLLVGVGTRTSGGCTSGHGLSGCGRLQPASLVATAVFFGSAIITSFSLEWLLS